VKSTCLLIALASSVLMSAARVETQAPSWAWKPTIPTVAPGTIEVLHVRGNVHMLVGAGGNITVHAGNDGVLLVDSGLESMSAKVIAAMRSISRGPLRYVINTTHHAEHVGGNAAVAAVGSTIPFRPPEDVRVSDGMRGKSKASVISFLTTFERMSAPTGKVAPWPEDAWPDNTYSTPQKKLYFNDEPVVVMHVPGTTDGNSVVHFRTSDVLSVGDLVDLTAYPVIDVSGGGSIEQLFAGLYRLIDLTVPNRKSEAGTLVIPGHGRLADQPDVVYYQQMVGIIRDRIKDMIANGMTLEQVKAARPTRDYDTRYGSPDHFVEAAYENLKNVSTK
jgi:glyoxylase-like metal-dependent hydrolase (beta-lactamase superfamily II)